MKVLESYIVQNDNGVFYMLYKADNGKPAGKWFIMTAGAFGTRDMELKSISPKKAAEWIAGSKSEK